MRIPGKILLVVVSEGHMQGEIPLYEFLVRRLRQLELAGATAIRAELGFGHYEAAHLDEPLEFPTDRPMVVFAVDSAEKIERALPEVRALTSEALVMLADAEQVLRA